MNKIFTHFLVLLLTVFIGANLAYAQRTQPDFNPPAEPDIQGLLSDLDTVNELPANRVPLDEKHISNEELIVYVRESAANLLNFHAGELEVVFDQNLEMFNDDGLSGYISFLRESGLYEKNMQDYKHITSIILDDPIILNQASLNGAYRWLTEIPILISFHDETIAKQGIGVLSPNPGKQERYLQTLKENKKKYVLQIQIRRVLKTRNNPRDLAIEIFKAVPLEEEQAF